MHNEWILPDSVGERVKTPGADWGPKGITLEYRYRNRVVVKWHGHNCFAGIGQREWHPTTWVVAQMDAPTRAVELCSIRAGRATQKTFQYAVAVAQNPVEADYWRARCSHCRLARGEHLLQKNEQLCPDDSGREFEARDE